MTQLWLVRHGQTAWNVEGRYQGQSDIPLNETGIGQAQALAQRLRGLPFDALYSSDLQRAHRTAEILAEALGLAIRVDARLREISQGRWEGMLLREVVQMYNGSLDERVRDPMHARAPGGESVGEVARRMALAAGDIARAFPAGRVLVASHGLAVAALVCQARDIPLAAVYDHIPENAVPEVIEWYPPDPEGE